MRSKNELDGKKALKYAESKKRESFAKSRQNQNSFENNSKSFNRSKDLSFDYEKKANYSKGGILE